MPSSTRTTGAASALLIVDDDAALRALLRTTFEVVDVEVEEAGSAEGALEAIGAGHPDAIVLDVRLPE